jgi:UDPglucose 6-dehydrogenase
MAACLASRGYFVTGVDVNRANVDALSSGHAPVREPGLDEIIRESAGLLTATDDFEFAVVQTQVTFIVVPTPSEVNGGFSLKFVEPAARAIGQALRRKSDYHVIVLTSTVLPGGTQAGVIDVLERESGKTCGRDFGVCYGPEFIALGTVIHDFLNPDFVLIGESDGRAGDMLEGLYEHVCLNKPPVARLSIPNAELAKLAVNTFVTMKISFANLLSAICEGLPGGDVDAVTGAVGLDSRIGNRYLRGGLAFGGPCFPRDNMALARLSEVLGLDSTLPRAITRANEIVGSRLSELVRGLVPMHGIVTVLGVAYKPHTPVVDESPGLKLAVELADAGVSVVVFDPLASESAAKILGERVAYAENPASAWSTADVVVLTHPGQAYAPADLEQVRRGRPVIVVDTWRSQREFFEHMPSVTYIPLGIGAAALVPA